MTNGDRLLPQDLDLEQAVLAVCFTDRSVDRVVNHIRPDEFFRTGYGEIFDAMLELDRKGARIDVLSVQNTLLTRGTLEQCGGFPVLMGLTTHHGSVTPSNGPWYAEQVRKKYIRRQMILAAADIENAAYDEEADLEECIARGESAFQSATQNESADDTCMDGQNLASQVLERIEADVAQGGKPRGLFSGLPDLDTPLGGMFPGELIIIAARTSMGKTALALTMMRNMVMLGKRVYYFSLEMPRDSIMQRLFAIEADVPMNRLSSRVMRPEELKEIQKARRRMEGCKFLVDDRAGVTPEYIRRQVRREMRRSPLSCVFVDHIHLMKTARYIDKTVERWGEISQQLKILARDLEVPVVALAQFSRGPEQRPDKTPQMSDLRESGRLEEDADKIISIFRPSYYKPRDVTEAKPINEDEEARLHIVKNRNGPIGAVPVIYLEKIGKFETIGLRKAEATATTTAQPSFGQASTEPADDPWADTPEDIEKRRQMDQTTAFFATLEERG